MSSNEGQGRAPSEEQTPTPEQSPSEKLRNETPTDALIPGAENPESEAVKQERNWNSE